MPIINQNLDTSEKKHDYSTVLGAVATGVTSLIKLIPFDCLMKGFNLAAFGLSGTPTYSLSVLRSVGGGQTAVALGVSLSGQAFGTSGPVGATITAPGITLLAGDVLEMISGTADTAIAGGVATVTISALADIKSYQNTVA